MNLLTPSFCALARKEGGDDFLELALLVKKIYHEKT